MGDATSVLDTVAKIFGIVSTLGLAVLGTKFWQWRSESRKLAADAANGEATAGETLVQTAMQLMNPTLVNAMGKRLTTLEQWAEDVRAWDIDQLGEWQRRSVAHTRAFMALAVANGWDLSSLPPVPGPPPEPPTYPRPGNSTTP